MTRRSGGIEIASDAHARRHERPQEGGYAAAYKHKQTQHYIRARPTSSLAEDVTRAMRDTRRKTNCEGESEGGRSHRRERQR